jgi:hypothetical protein
MNFSIATIVSCPTVRIFYGRQNGLWSFAVSWIIQPRLMGYPIVGGVIVAARHLRKVAHSANLGSNGPILWVRSPFSTDWFGQLRVQLLHIQGGEFATKRRDCMLFLNTVADGV